MSLVYAISFAVFEGAVVLGALGTAVYLTRRLGFREPAVLAEQPVLAERYISKTGFSTDPEQRAQELLVRLLTPAQQAEFAHRWSVTVIGRKYNFRILLSSPYIEVLTKEGNAVDALGFYCPKPLPEFDRMIAQLMFVRGDLHEIERRACHSRIGPRFPLQ